jgi:hypothetical protein
MHWVQPSDTVVAICGSETRGPLTDPPAASGGEACSPAGRDGTPALCATRPSGCSDNHPAIIQRRSMRRAGLTTSELRPDINHRRRRNSARSRSTPARHILKSRRGTGQTTSPCPLPRRAAPQTVAHPIRRQECED